MAGSYRSQMTYFNGLECKGCDGNHAGLGFIDPVSSSMMLTSATQSLSQAIEAISDFLGIGEGRREADLIVPTQNEITATVLAPISDAVQHPEIDNASCSDLTALLDTLNKAEQRWLTFLHDDRWTDGRASAQAEATLAPYFDGLRKNLTDEINARCKGFIGTVFDGEGSNNTMLLAGLGIAALMLPRLMKRRG